MSVLPYLPGLDGMRALAVVAVMVYHTHNGWLPGGFIGVEVFFVISGYLITLLLIGEHERTGRVELGQFWVRRARRLLPALFFMLVALMSYTALVRRGELARLRGDVIAGVADVSNWYQIWTGQGYTAVMEWAPLRHLWSLAVEEQFYLVWPLVMVVLLRLGRHRLPNASRWLLLVAVLVTVAVALAVPTGPAVSPAVTPEAYWTVAGRAVSKTDTLYLSTLTRSTGLLIGAAFAMMWRPTAVMRGPVRDKGWVVDVLAAVGLASLGVLAWQLHVTTASGPDPRLFRGGFLGVALATVMVIAAVTHARALTGRVLGHPVLVWIGVRSYGLYLFHWPIYQIIRKVSGNRLTPAQFGVALALTLVVTEISFRLVEMPVRRRRWGRTVARLRRTHDPVPRRIVGVGAAACLSVVAFAAASLATAELRPSEFEVSQAEGEQVVEPLLPDPVGGGPPPGAPLAGPAPTPADPALAAAPDTTEPAGTTEPPETTEPGTTEPAGASGS
ncbi:MAG: acyltransferase, partial [Acidimicrobiia bacterium]|nr:acyltransferase [Acidimicrobiia bacterium]